MKNQTINTHKITLTYRPNTNSLLTCNVSLLIYFDTKKEMKIERRASRVTMEVAELINNMMKNKALALIQKDSKDKNIQKFYKIKTNMLIDSIPESNFDVFKEWHQKRKEIKYVEKDFKLILKQIGKDISYDKFKKTTKESVATINEVTEFIKKFKESHNIVNDIPKILTVDEVDDAIRLVNEGKIRYGKPNRVKAKMITHYISKKQNHGSGFPKGGLSR